jgi:hypothetical protein
MTSMSNFTPNVSVAAELDVPTSVGSLFISAYRLPLEGKLVRNKRRLESGWNLLVWISNILPSSTHAICQRRR